MVIVSKGVSQFFSMIFCVESFTQNNLASFNSYFLLLVKNIFSGEEQ
jgi:hypothetical protein